MSLRLELQLERESFQPGEAVNGSVLVAEGGGSRALEAALEVPGYRSEHGELYWELDVKSDEAGFDTHVRRRIEVLPPRRTEEPDLFGADFADSS